MQDDMNSSIKEQKRSAMTQKRAAQAKRKREQRIRQAEAVQDRDSHEWTDAECLAILTAARWRGGAIDKGAWEQLGKLRGFA